MKKKISLILALTMLLSGCNSTTTPEATAKTTTTAETTTTTAPITTTAINVTTTVPVTVKETTTTAKQTFENISVEEYLKTSSSFDNGFFNGKRITNEAWFNGNFTLMDDGRIIRDLPKGGTYYSLKGILLAGDEIPLLEKVVSESENATFEAIAKGNYDYYDMGSEYEYDNPYEFSQTPIILDVEKCTTGGSVYINEGTYSLYTEKEITVNCFIRQNGDMAEVIVDPMYSFYLPCSIEDNSEHLYYHTINDVETVMSTPLVAAAADEATLSALTDEYMYCSAVLDDYTMNVYLSKPAEYSCALKSFEIIETNGADALTKTYLNFYGEEKPDKMSEMYNALMEIKDKWYNENCFGMLLLDLDFDEIPEVLLTSINRNDENVYFGTCTSIYRLVNGSLEYVDYFIPALGFTGGDSFITSSTDENGNKKWYVAMETTEEGKIDGYYQPVGSYVRGFMTLDENGIEFEEIFSSWNEDIDAEDGVRSSHILFYMGEPFSENADIYESAVAYQAEQYDGYQLEWSAQYAFSERMDNEAYYLNTSDFIYDAYVYSALIPQTERMLAYNLAKVVDEGFLGVCHKGEKSFYFGDGFAKPVIYLYPEEKTDVSVQVEFAGEGELTCTYPEYAEGWNVTAMPDGTLYDKDGNEYYCLYWEGEGEYNLDFSKGFCIKGEDTADFLREKLIYMGLTAREANEFIIYWLPIMQENPYNIITFHTDDYASAVPLTVSPTPDSVIRLFMTFRASENKAAILPQTLPQYERSGFTVVEWGGGEIK